MLAKYERIEHYFYRSKEIYSTKQKYCWYSNPDWILSQTAPKEVTKILTWQNVSEEYKHLKASPFYIKQTKKGRKIKTYWDVKDVYPEARLKFKEWKDNFEITVKVEYKLVTPKLKEVFEEWPAPYAIKYITEHGLTINKIKELQ